MIFQLTNQFNFADLVILIQEWVYQIKNKMPYKKIPAGGNYVVCNQLIPRLR